MFTYHSFFRQRNQKGRQASETTAAAVTKSSRGRETSRETRRQRQPKAAQNGNHEGDTLGRQGGSGITTIWRFRESATQSLRNKNPYIASSYLGNEGKGDKSRRETRWQRQGFWETGLCRETNEGRLGGSGRDFGNQHAGRQMKGRETHEEGSLCGGGRDFGNPHAGRQMKGRETNEEGRLGGSGRTWESACRETNEGKGDKWRRETRWQRQGFWESACRETNEGKGDKWRRETRWQRQGIWESARRETNEGRLGTQPLRSKNPYSFQLSWEWRRVTRSGSDFGNHHAGRLGISMQGDKWRETNEEAGAAAISVISNPTFEK